ncbi:XRE family transcriptional regulator [Kribbella hippodromi]
MPTTQSTQNVQNVQNAIDAALDRLGPRLRRIREQKDLSLAALSRSTGISTSTLSRLESGQRRPALDLLLRIAAALAVPLDTIIAAPRLVAGPHPGAGGRTFLTLTASRSVNEATKLTIASGESDVFLRTHPGSEWLYVLSGRLRLVLGAEDLVLRPGDAAEFDTRHPHWFGAVGNGQVEVLSLFSAEGRRVRVRARSVSRPLS